MCTFSVSYINYSCLLGSKDYNIPSYQPLELIDTIKMRKCFLSLLTTSLFAHFNHIFFQSNLNNWSIVNVQFLFISATPPKNKAIKNQRNAVFKKQSTSFMKSLQKFSLVYVVLSP